MTGYGSETPAPIIWSCLFAARSSSVGVILVSGSLKLLVSIPKGMLGEKLEAASVIGATQRTVCRLWLPLAVASTCPKLN